MTEREFWGLIVRHLKGIVAAVEKHKLTGESYEVNSQERIRPPTDSTGWLRREEIVDAPDGERMCDALQGERQDDDGEARGEVGGAEAPS